MNNYLRAIRITFRFKYSIVLSILCALLVGLAWGGNITVLVYPIVEVCMKKDTFGDWLNRRIEENGVEIIQYTEKTDTLRTQLEQTEELRSQRRLQRELSAELTRLNRAEYFQALYLWGKPYVDKYAPNDPFKTVLLIISFALIGTAIKLVLTVAQNILSAHIAQGTANQLREEFFSKVIQYDAGQFNHVGIAQIMSRFTGDVSSLVGGLGTLYGKLVREPFKMITCLVLAAMISWQLLLLTLLLVPIAAYLIRWLARSIKRTAKVSMQEMANMFSRLEEAFRSIRVIKVFCRESYEENRFRLVNNTLYKQGMKVAKYDSLTNPLTEALGILMICAAVLAGAYLVMDERTDIWGIPMSSVPLSQPMLLMFFGLLAGASDPARKLSDIFTQFQTAAAAADRVYEMIDKPIQIVDPADPVPYTPCEKAITFEKVSFEYQLGHPVLKEVSLKINYGETVAIIGPSGCGKSTLLGLIPRFEDPNQGEVKLDGIALSRFTLHDLRRQIGLVTQEPVLFNDTIRNNIKYGMPDATDEAMIEAAQQAYADDFIMKELKDGYDTIVGPGGGLLSGGQRQRISLARAFLINPRIFLLDEATSQIDLLSEQAIHKALAQFIGNRTTIMVTHRLSALTLANRIIIMRDGVIEDIGTHEELLVSSSFYNRLHHLENLEE
ncbi:MAG: ABC transporter ATP-binding protein [Thermoguttaceae bacterium]